jgi:hypothetical protein
MKKKIVYGISVLAIAAAAAWNVSMNSQKNGLSDVMLANAEALAQEGGSVSSCPGGSCSWGDSHGNNCTACCPSEKNPSCSSFTCKCD